MTELPQFPAKYEPGRDSTGKFAKGNQLAKGRTSEVSRKLAGLRSLWYDVQSEEDMIRVKAELIKLCTDCPNPDVKLKAIVYYIDRMLGKPTERVEVENTGGGSPLVNINLSPEERAVAERIVRKMSQTDQDEPPTLEVEVRPGE